MRIELWLPVLRRLARIVVGSAIAAMAGMAALPLWFVGAVETTGCFMTTCDEPDLLKGLPALAGSALAASVAVTSLVWAFGTARRALLVRVMVWSLAVAVAAVVALTANAT